MQKLVDLVIVVVVVSDSPHTLDVVPAGSPEQARVNTGVTPHGAVGQVVDCPELVVQALRRVLVKSRDGRVSLLVPGEVLDPECGELVLPLGEVHVLEVDVPDVVCDVGLDAGEVMQVTVTCLFPNLVKAGLKLLLGRRTVLIPTQGRHFLHELLHFVALLLRAEDLVGAHDVTDDVGLHHDAAHDEG